MPTYVYRCEHCVEEFERIETISEHEASKPKCPSVQARHSSGCPRFTAMTSKKS
jgi:putative FmdB family regulatory protein